MSDEKYRAILESDPTDTQAFVALCSSAERNNDYQYLAQLYDFRAQVIADTQEIADLYFKSGEIYLDKLGDTPKGVELLLRGFEADHTHAGIGDRLDAVYREAGDWESAVQIIEQRLEALTGADVNGTKTVIRSDLHQQAGEIWEKVYTDRKRALTHYKRAIELDKTNLLALYSARDIYYQAGKYKNAAKLCELEARSEKDVERRSALYRELSQIYQDKLEQTDAAVIALKRALKATPQSTDVQAELAQMIALTPWTADSAKDHKWSAEYLIRMAEGAEGFEAVELASLAVVAHPTGDKALDFLEAEAEKTGNFNQLAATLEEILARIPDADMRNKVIGRLAEVYRARLGNETAAAEWQAKYIPDPDADPSAGADASYQSLMPAAESETPATPAPDAAIPSAPIPAAPTPASSAPIPAAPVPAPIGSFPPPPMPAVGAPSAPAVATQEPPHASASPEEEATAVSQEASAAQPIPDAALDMETPIMSEPAVPAAPTAADAASVPMRDPGVSDEAYAEILRQASDRSRRVGDDATAELCLLQVLDMFPFDQKAITFLERRFRARSDWFSLRDLLLRSAGSPHLPLAVQTVRLREAARLSEEQLSDIPSAVQAWNRIRENDPKVRDAVDALIRLLHQAGEWDELRELLEQEIETTKSRTKKVEAYRKLAEIYHLHTENTDAAAEAYGALLELMPDDLGAIEALEEIYQKTERFTEVVELLRKRAGLTTDRGEKRDLLFRAAQVLRENLELLEEAYTQAKDVLAVSKDDAEVLAFLTALDEEAERWSRLINVLDLRIQAAEESEEKVRLLRKKAACAADKLEDTQIAVKSLNELLGLAPDDIEAMDSLLEIYRKTENWERMVQLLPDRIEASADRAEQAALHRERAQVLESKLGRESDAIAEWKAVLAIEPDGESLGALARFYERGEDWEALVGVLEQQSSHAAEPKERAEILFHRAKIIDEKQKNRALAITELTRILNEVDSEDEATLNLLITLLTEENRYAEAADLQDRRIAQTHDRDAAKALLMTLGGWCTDELKDLERAMDTYEKAVQLDREDTEVLDALDAVYTSLKEWDKLLKLLYARAKAAPDDAVRLTLLSRGASVCEESLEDKKKAWTWHIEILDKLGNNAEAVDFVETAARRMELWKEFIDLAGVMTKKATEVSEQVEWWLKAADVLEEKLEQPSQALEAVLRAFGLEPDNEALLDRVDRLAVSVGNLQRLSVVYGVLVKRLEQKEEKISLLSRYAAVLRDDAKRPSDAFDIAVKAFEMDPDSESLLETVEELGRLSGRWDDLVRIYNGCASLASVSERKIALKIRAARMLRDKKVDADAALAMLLDAIRIAPMDETVTPSILEEVSTLETDLVPAEAGTYWNRVVELYRTLADESKKDPERRFALLCRTSDIYIEKLEDTTAAFEVLKENQTVNPKDERNLDKLEELAEKNDAWQALANHYQDVLDETFDMTVAVMLHRRRGRILQERLDRPEEAAEHFWQIIQLDASDSRAYEALITHYETAEKWNDLVNLLERRLDNSRDDEEKRGILLQIAGIWEDRIGNRYEAKDWYEQVLTLWPESEAATAGLERLALADSSRVGEDSTMPDSSDDDEEDEDMRALISMPPPPDDPEPEEPEPSSEEEATVSDDAEEDSDEADADNSDDAADDADVDDADDFDEEGDASDKERETFDEEEDSFGEPDASGEESEEEDSFGEPDASDEEIEEEDSFGEPDASNEEIEEEDSFGEPDASGEESEEEVSFGEADTSGEEDTPSDEDADAADDTVTDEIMEFDTSDDPGEVEAAAEEISLVFEDAEDPGAARAAQEEISLVFDASDEDEEVQNPDAETDADGELIIDEELLLDEEEI